MVRVAFRTEGKDIEGVEDTAGLKERLVADPEYQRLLASNPSSLSCDVWDESAANAAAKAKRLGRIAAAQQAAAAAAAAAAGGGGAEGAGASEGGEAAAAAAAPAEAAAPPPVPTDDGVDESLEMPEDFTKLKTDAKRFPCLRVVTALQLRSIAIQPPALTLDESRTLTLFYERGGCWSVGQDVVFFNVLTGRVRLRCLLPGHDSHALTA